MSLGYIHFHHFDIIMQSYCMFSGTVALELQHTRMMSSSSDILLGRQGSRKNKLELPSGLNIQSLQKRPSIAPVPAMLDCSSIHITLGEDSDSNSDNDILYADEEEEFPE